MRILILGASGRVGANAVRLATEARHQVTAFVRDPARFEAPSGVAIAVGDLTRPETLAALLPGDFDAVINAVGVDPLKPSTFVTDAARILVPLLEQAGLRRYVAVSGTACMPKTAFGEVAMAVLRMTPVRHSIRDHLGAFEIVTNSALDWTLAGCPWIKEGPAVGFSEHSAFRGGMKRISPADVAAFLVKVVDRSDYVRRIVGIW
jgi:putative NADH-flavin reductase